MLTETPAIWYRYEDVKYAPPLDEYDMPYGEGRLAVELRRYVVVRETPKGVWVVPFYGKPDEAKDSLFRGSSEKFIRNSAVKKHAYPTVEEAKKGFIARKNAQLRILRAGVKRAEEALRILEISTPQTLAL